MHKLVIVALALGWAVPTLAQDVPAENTPGEFVLPATETDDSEPVETAEPTPVEPVDNAPSPYFTGDDLFGLSVGSDPQISPDGQRIAYVRRTNDIMSDKPVRSIWLIDVASGRQTPLVAGAGSHGSPRWSPDGGRLAFISTHSGGGPQLHVMWLDSGRAANITALPQAPGAPHWSPDGTRIAYTARVPAEGPKLGKPPAKPEGAQWAEPLLIYDRVVYRADGQGYVPAGTQQLFIVDAEGGAPRQLTSGAYDNGGEIDWSPDGRTLLYSANRREDYELEPLGSEIFALDIASGAIRPLTSRNGPDVSPRYSPDGKRVAYLGFDDQTRAFQQTNLYVMDADGSNVRQLAAGLDRGFDSLEWTEAGLFAGFEDRGEYRVARVGTDGAVRQTPVRSGSDYYAVPYAGGQWSVSRNGRIAFTSATTTRPADISVAIGGDVKRLTELNEVKLSGKALGRTRELAVTAPDGTVIPAWIMLPPGYQPGTRVPLVLEIHGGPYASYGPVFSADYQLYGAAGYAVAFANPGGSTGYGQAFADRIEGNYPISNYDELMAVVDAAIAEGVADPDNLFVTGGSGGGLLTAWIVGKTDRFAAAASHKPVINWMTTVLVGDTAAFFGRYWMGGKQVWDDLDGYWSRSPLSLAGNVSTPTMLLVGAEDYRTPRSEAEQFYTALKLRGVDTALVVTPDSSHSNLSQSPSQQAARTATVIAWFEKYRQR